MAWFWHTISQFVWLVSAIIGFILAAIAWFALAIWENGRKWWRKLAGEIDPPAGPPDGAMR